MTFAEEKKYKELLSSVNGDETKAFDLWLRWKCLTDLYFLGCKIFGWEKSIDKTGKRKRVDPSFHRWLAHLLQKPEDKLILLPRGHLKSTWVKAAIVQDILRNPNIRIGLFSVSSRLVEQQLADIKRMFCTPLLLRLFPDIIPKPGKDYKNWQKSTADLLTIKRDKTSQSGALQAEQITALGSGAKITGMHIDKAYVDDIIDPSTVTTAEQMKKSEEWWEYIQSVLEIDGITTMVGTHYHWNDLYAKIIREKQFKRRNIYKRSAIENGKVLYSSWFTLEDFEKIKKRQSNYIFSCQYLLNPVPKEDQIFPAPQPTFATLPADKYTYYITLDPAATTEAYSDETGMIIAAVNKINQIFIIEALRFKKKGNEIADILIQKCMQYKPLRVGIEFGLQEHLRYIIETRKSAFEQSHKVSVPLNIVSIPISRKMSKGARINLTLGAFIREGKFLINERCIDLLGEMDSFTGKGNERDNLVDAAAMIFSVIDQFSYRYWVKSSYLGGDMRTFFDIFKDNNSYEWRKEFIA